MAAPITDIFAHTKYADAGAPLVTGANPASAERNREFIATILEKYLKGTETVFEIGTGTADQSVYFAKKFPQIQWHTSDCKELYLEKICETLQKATLSNIFPPVKFDIDEDQIEGSFDAVYASNVIHCIPEQTLQTLLEKVSRALKRNGFFILYGPFNNNGGFTSPGNEAFDKKLKTQHKSLGLQSIEHIAELAKQNGLTLHAKELHAAANNFVLILKK